MAGAAARPVVLYMNSTAREGQMDSFVVMMYDIHHWMYDMVWRVNYNRPEGCVHLPEKHVLCKILTRKLHGRDGPIVH